LEIRVTMLENKLRSLSVDAIGKDWVES